MTIEQKRKAKFKPEFVNELAEKMRTLSYSDFYDWYFKAIADGIDKKLVNEPTFGTIKSTKVLHLNHGSWVLTADVLDDGSNLTILSFRSIGDEYTGYAALVDSRTDMKKAVLEFLESPYFKKWENDYRFPHVGKAVKYFKEYFNPPEEKPHTYSGASSVVSFEYLGLKFNFYFNTMALVEGKYQPRDICILTSADLYGVAIRNPIDKFDAREAMKHAIKNAEKSSRDGKGSKPIGFGEATALYKAVLGAWMTHFNPKAAKLGRLVMASGLVQEPGLGTYVKGS